MRAKLHNAWVKFVCIRQKKPRWLHDGHEFAHLAYFGTLFATGTGIYAKVAGVLFITGALLVFFRDGEV